MKLKDGFYVSEKQREFSCSEIGGYGGYKQ